MPGIPCKPENQCQPATTQGHQPADRHRHHPPQDRSPAAAPPAHPTPRHHTRNRTPARQPAKPKAQPISTKPNALPKPDAAVNEQDRQAWARRNIAQQCSTLGPL
jgi:hypothetical protein